MYKVIILPLAKEDIQIAAKWYNKRRKGLGKRFTTQIRQKLAFIAKHPLAIAIRYDAVRTAPLPNFPYMIHYVIEEAEQQVVIIAVFHTSRDSAVWGTR